MKQPWLAYGVPLNSKWLNKINEIEIRHRFERLNSYPYHKTPSTNKYYTWYTRLTQTNGCLQHSCLKIHIKIKLLKINAIASIGTCCLPLPKFIDPTYQFTWASVVGWEWVRHFSSAAWLHRPEVHYNSFTI